MIGIVKNASVSCHPKGGTNPSPNLLKPSIQSVLRSPYTGPSRLGNHRKDSPVDMVDMEIGKN